MSDKSYIVYLETVVESLLAERAEPLNYIVAISELPPYKGFTFLPYNIHNQIKEKRLARTKFPE